MQFVYLYFEFCLEISYKRQEFKPNKSEKSFIDANPLKEM